MSRAAFVLTAVAIGAFGFGYGAGYFSNPGRADSNVSDPVTHQAHGSESDASAQEDVHANTLLSQRIRELEQQAKAPKPDPEAELKERMALYRKFRNRGLYVQCVNFYGPGPVTVTDGAAALLGLSTDEKQALEQRLTDAKREMEALRDGDTKLAKQSADSVAYDIALDPKGAEIKSQLTQAMTQAVGSDRASFLMEQSGFDSPVSPYANFSAQKTNVQIKWKSDPSGKPIYSWRVATGNNTWSNGDQYNQFVPDSLKKYLPEFDTK